MRRSVRLVFAGVVALGGALAVAAPASAAPADCTVSQLDNGAQVVCASGTGEFRIAIECENAWTGLIQERFGQWVPPGQVSQRSCRFGELFAGSTVDTRG